MAVLTPIEVSRILASYAHILVIEDDEAAGEGLKQLLEREGYEITLAKTGTEGLQELTEGEAYDLLLLDVMLPGLNGWAILNQLRSKPSTARLPVIMVTAMTGERDEIELLKAGADDYIAKPFDFENLMARIRALLRRAVLQTINPLTGLPGNRQVERFLQRCAKEEKTFWAAAYIDIDDFKAYNDFYGFLKGDKVLKATADLISRIVNQCEYKVFVGNIGGDDFLVGFARDVPRQDGRAAEEVKQVLESIAAEFDKMSQQFYSEEHLARGFIEAEGRRGDLERHSLMALSIAVVTNARRSFKHHLAISSTFASVKRRAKSQPGSAVCFDLRGR